jgi:hypothetical protein
MKASVGRIVHYRINDDTVLPAIVVKVHSDLLLNLTVFLDADSVANDLSLFGINEKMVGVAHKKEVAWGHGVQQWSWPQREV